MDFKWYSICVYFDASQLLQSCSVHLVLSIFLSLPRNFLLVICTILKLLNKDALTILFSWFFLQVHMWLMRQTILFTSIWTKRLSCCSNLVDSGDDVDEDNNDVGKFTYPQKRVKVKNKKKEKESSMNIVILYSELLVTPICTNWQFVWYLAGCNQTFCTSSLEAVENTYLFPFCHFLPHLISNILFTLECWNLNLEPLGKPSHPCST